MLETGPFRTSQTELTAGDGARADVVAEASGHPCAGKDSGPVTSSNPKRGPSFMLPWRPVPGDTADTSHGEERAGIDEAREPGRRAPRSQSL